MTRLLPLLLLLGCDAQFFDTPYKVEPQIDRVIVQVVWTSPENIRSVCKNDKAYACATVGSVERPFSTIYAIKPKSFSDRALVEALGHELLHSLGAEHL